MSKSRTAGGIKLSISILSALVRPNRLVSLNQLNNSVTVRRSWSYPHVKSTVWIGYSVEMRSRLPACDWKALILRCNIWKFSSRNSVGIQTGMVTGAKHDFRRHIYTEEFVDQNQFHMVMCWRYVDHITYRLVHSNALGFASKHIRTMYIYMHIPHTNHWGIYDQTRGSVDPIEDVNEFKDLINVVHREK